MALMGVYLGFRMRSLAFGIAWGSTGLLVCWPLTALGIKRGLGRRPQAEDHPSPTYTRPWTRVSDKWLRLNMWLAGGLSVLNVINLISSKGSPGYFLVLALWVLVLWSLERERRRRQGQP